MATTQTAVLVELFSAIQGEGANVGTRQLFIRFAGCDLRCRYCDSAHTWHPTRECHIEVTPGQRDFISVPNPVTLEQLLSWCDRQNHPKLHDSISLTGGEPLLHGDFLEKFLPRLKSLTGLPLYLETGGHHPNALRPLLPHLDSIGMDIKLPSVSGECYWSAHHTFLDLCHQAKVDVFCKVIISHTTTDSDLEQLRSLVIAINPHIPVFLQPVTPIGTGRHILPPEPGQVLMWQAALKEQLRTVRVIPQTHKFIQQR